MGNAMPKMKYDYFAKIIRVGAYLGAFLIFFGIGFCSAFMYRAPLVSVIIPTYNRADLLPRAVDSILAQTLTDFELIVIDDGSTDDTQRILNVYAQQDKRVKVLINEHNCGVSCARNKGLASARGTYVSMLDSDDYAMADMLERQVRYMRKHPELAAVTGDYYSLDSFDTVPPVAPRTVVFNHFKMTPAQVRVNHLFTSTLSQSGACYKKDFLDKNAVYYNETFASAEDYDFFRQILMHRGLIAWANEVWTINRVHFSHDKAYYQNMHRNSSHVKRQLYAPYWQLSDGEDAYRHMLPWERCAMMQKILENWTDNGWLFKSDISDYLTEFCPNQTA